VGHTSETDAASAAKALDLQALPVSPVIGDGLDAMIQTSLERRGWFCRTFAVSRSKRHGDAQKTQSTRAQEYEDIVEPWVDDAVAELTFEPRRPSLACGRHEAQMLGEMPLLFQSCRSERRQKRGRPTTPE
jgi:hypothetical protein